MSKVKNQILELLQVNNIEFKHMQHPAAETSQEVAKLRGTDPNIGAKALLIKTKQDYYLCVLEAPKKLDSKKFRQATGIKKMRFINQEELLEKFQLLRGAVPPFGNLLDISQTFFDIGLLKHKKLAFNIGTKTESILIDTQDLVQLVKPEIIEFCESV